MTDKTSSRAEERKGTPTPVGRMGRPSGGCWFSQYFCQPFFFFSVKMSTAGSGETG